MIRFREAGRADLTRLFDLDQVCFPQGIAYSLREFQALLRSSRTMSVVAEEHEALAGFAIAQRHRIQGVTSGHIVTIDVAPKFRRRGVGRSMMEQIEVQLRQMKAVSIRLEVAVDNIAAQAFYLGLGFEPLGILQDYYRDGLDGMVLEKVLS